MGAENPVFRSLITSGNQSPLAAGSRVSALAHGQIGIFNYHTGLSVDGSVPTDARDIFLAVGINKTSGSGSMETFNKSAGQSIRVDGIKALTVKGYVAEIPKQVIITGFSALCETDYQIKVEFRNAAIYMRDGYNPFTQTYNYRTGCCADSTSCLDCPQTGNPVELAQGLVTNINADINGMLVAALFGWKITATITGSGPTSDANTVVTIGSTTYTVAVLDADTAAQAAQKIVTAINNQTGSPYYATLSGAVISIYAKTTAATNTATFAVSGAGVTAGSIVAATKTVVTDSTAFQLVYPGVSLGIRLTGVSESRPASNGNINLRYHKTGTDFIVSFVQGFTCNGTITTEVDLQLAEGQGYDILEEEYEEGGWEGKPGVYRQSSVTGLQRNGFEFYASATANYNIITFEYQDISTAGSNKGYYAALRTRVNIPCADSTTLTGLVAMLDLIFTKVQAMTNDVASMDCTNTNTSTINNAATDGIELISY